jgi:hypothetical protein
VNLIPKRNVGWECLLFFGGIFVWYNTMNHIVTQGYKKQLDHILEEIEMGGVNVGHFNGTTKDWH